MNSTERGKGKCECGYGACKRGYRARRECGLQLWVKGRVQRGEQGRENAVMRHTRWVWGAQGRQNVVMGQRKRNQEGNTEVVIWVCGIERGIDRGTGKVECGYGA